MKARTAKVERLVAYLCDGVAKLPGEDLDGELGEWLSASSRFAAFVEASSDKIRKKLRTAGEPEARGDVLAELRTAYFLLADRRFELGFEAYGSGRRGPDFTVTFRASHRFNLEVTRPRIDRRDPGDVIAGALITKLRQLPADSPNAIFVASPLVASSANLETSVRSLKMRAERGNDEPFASKGTTAKEFRTLFHRVGLLLAGSDSGTGVHGWVNLEARRSLPGGSSTACVAALARWGRTTIENRQSKISTVPP